MENTPWQGKETPRRDRRAVLGLLLGLPLLSVGGSTNAVAQTRRRRFRRFREMQNQVRELVASGEVRPLREVVAALKEEVDGDIIDVEFHSVEDAYFYQFKILNDTGRIADYFVHAQTKKVMTLAEARKLFPHGIADIMDQDADGELDVWEREFGVFSGNLMVMKYGTGDFEIYCGQGSYNGAYFNTDPANFVDDDVEGHCLLSLINCQVGTKEVTWGAIKSIS